MKRSVKKLTELELKKAAVKEDKDYNLSDGDGLYFIVRRNGSKFFRLDFRYGGKRLSMSLGTYPKISLKEARDKKDECKKLLSENINPISEKRVKKSSESLTLGMIIDEWLELRAKSSSEATVTQNRRMLKNITNWLGNIAIKDIKRVDIINILEKIQNKGIIETAHRLLSLMNKIYMFAVTKEYIEHNIFADIDKKSVLIPSNKNIHHPAITIPSEIKELLKDINSIREKYKSHITLVVWKLDRLGRSLAHLISVITDLKNKNVSFVSITEGMDTTTASGELFFHIFGALAQFERSLIQERVKAGLEAAKNRGIRGGRPRAIDTEKMIAIKKALDDGMTKAAICRTFGVKRSTLIDSLNRENI